MNTIYVFCNTKCGGLGEWHSATALSDEGLFLGGHCCSNHGFIPGDMGADGHKDWSGKRAAYARAYPDGFEVVYVESASDPRVLAAHAKHKAMTKEQYDARLAGVFDPVPEKREEK